MMNCDEKLGKFLFLKIKLQDESMKSKITLFGLILVEKLKSKIKREKWIVKRKKMIKFYKIKLI